MKVTSKLLVLALALTLGSGYAKAQFSEIPGREDLPFPETPATEDSPSVDNGGSAQEEAEKIAVKIGPAYYLDFDFGMKAVNLTPHDWSLKTRVPELQADRYKNGFKVTRFANIEGGIGPEAVFYYDNVSSGLKEILYASVGLYPLVGSSWMAEYYVPKREDIRSKRAPRLPYKADDLANWTAGDKVSYESTGGIVFEAGLGLGYWVGVGATSTAAGKWKTLVTKTDDFTATVEITDTDVHELNAYVGNLLVKVGKSKFRNESAAFAYAFDLRSTRARMAFEDFQKGNILAVQKLVANGNLPDVYKVTKTNVSEAGTGSHFFFGIPILWFYEWGASRIKNFTTEENFPNGTKISADYGVYYEEGKTRAFFNHRNTVISFTGAAYNYSDKETPSLDAYYGEFYYTYGADNSSHFRLRQAMNSLIRLTGMKKDLTVGIPALDPLYYAGLEFRMMISSEQTDRLMAAAATLGRGTFVAQGEQAFFDYFGNNKKATDLKWDVNDVCADHGYEAERCYDEMKRETNAALVSMHDALATMKRSLGKDRKAFAYAYGSFGKAMATNQFTFQYAVKLAGPGVKATYTVEGERLSRFEKELATSEAGAWSVTSPVNNRLSVIRAVGF